MMARWFQENCKLVAWTVLEEEAFDIINLRKK